MVKILAVDSEGNLSYCSVPEDQRGTGNCPHQDHAGSSENIKSFMNRTAAKNNQAPKSPSNFSNQRLMENYTSRNSFNSLSEISSYDDPIRENYETEEDFNRALQFNNEMKYMSVEIGISMKNAHNRDTVTAEVIDAEMRHMGVYDSRTLEKIKMILTTYKYYETDETGFTVDPKNYGSQKFNGSEFGEEPHYYFMEHYGNVDSVKEKLKNFNDQELPTIARLKLVNYIARYRDSVRTMSYTDTSNKKIKFPKFTEE